MDYARIRAWLNQLLQTAKVTRMKTALLIMIFVAAASPGSATDKQKQNLDQPRWDDPSHVNCETVRAYVDQVGLAQATALARAAGMTAWQEWRARRCLTKKV